jgi:O-antigen/teichoic acid export membrane protein
MSTKTVFANMGRLLSGKIAAGLISLIYIAIAARTLGVREYGVLNLVHGYAVFMGGLIAFSGFHGLVTYGAEALQEQDHGRLAQLIRVMSLIEIAMATLAIIVSILLAEVAGRAMHWPPEAIQFAPVYSLAILATVRATPWALLQLANRFDLIAIHQVVMPATRLIGAFFILALDGGLRAFLWIWLLAALAEGLSMWIMAWWVYRRMNRGSAVNKGWSGDVRTKNPGLIKFIALTNFDLTLRDFAPRAAPLIVGWVAGPAVAGIFILAQRASASLTQPPQLLGQALYSTIAQLISAKNNVAAAIAVRRSALIIASGAFALAAVMAIFARELLLLLGGPDFVGGASILALILFSRAIVAPTQVWSSAMTALGKPQASMRANLIGNVALLPMLPPMVWYLGPEGAGWHSVLQAMILAALCYLAYRAAISGIEERTSV